MNLSLYHRERIQAVCDFIHGHLDQDMDLALLSEIAACSKYHFHRVFKAQMGVSTIQFVLLMRLKRASFRLAFEPEHNIIDIAYEARFDSPEAFSRAFSRLFGQSPSQFRSQPEWQSWHSKYEFDSLGNKDNMMDVRIVDFNEREVALVEHRGSPKLVFDTAAKFIAWRKATGLSPINTSETFGIPYSDPNDTPDDEFRFDICGSHKGVVPENNQGVRAGVIPAGRCAMVLHKGNQDLIGETIYYLYQDWLPQSGEALRDFPCFFKYLNFIHQVDECDLLTEVYLPLK